MLTRRASSARSRSISWSGSCALLVRSRCTRFLTVIGLVTGMQQMPTGAFSSVPMTISCSRSDRIFQPSACVQTGPGPAGRGRQRRCDAVGQACRQHARAACRRTTDRVPDFLRSVGHPFWLGLRTADFLVPDALTSRWPVNRAGLRRSADDPRRPAVSPAVHREPGLRVLESEQPVSAASPLRNRAEATLASSDGESSRTGEEAAA